MLENIISVKNLVKKYGNKTVLDDINLDVKKGQIYGLVGKNGAGKTTLLRILAGQSFKTSGYIELFSQSDQSGLENARKKTGSIIEDASFIPYFSARKNLEYYKIQRGIVGEQIIDEVLSLVGLNDVGKKPFKSFSLGMKQRLGIALAIINNPELLILDEPINGLDPIGIVQIRNLLLKLNQEKNVTIIISSHILSELSMIATNYAFIDQGRIIEKISDDDLKNKCNDCVQIVVDDPRKATFLLEEKLQCKEYMVLPDNTINVYKFTEDPCVVNNMLILNGVSLKSSNILSANLEEYFMKLIGEKDNA